MDIQINGMSLSDYIKKKTQGSKQGGSVVIGGNNYGSINVGNQNVSFIDGEMFIDGVKQGEGADSTPRITKNFDASKMKEINLNTVFNIEIDNSPNAKNTIEITASEEQMKKIIVAEGPNTMVSLHSGNFSGVTMKVSSTQLEKIRQFGTGNIKGHFEGEKLELITSGTGNINLEGQVEKLKVESSGTGNVKLLDLEAQYVKATLSGVGKTELTALQELTIHASGVGKVNYQTKGNKIATDINSTGLSKVVCLDGPEPSKPKMKW